ncbi:MAG: CoA transferase [Pseudomonadota bacterium]
MPHLFDTAIEDALGRDMDPGPEVQMTNPATLPSCYQTSALAASSIGAAGRELAALTGAERVTLDGAHASAWFDMTLQPIGWEMPSVWDDIAGVYRAQDGWIRLHTNAPHHRAAALEVLGCAPEADAVKQAVAAWSAADLETAVVSAGGAAAQMRDAAAWAAHPQGQAVAQEPLIAWEETAQGAAPVKLSQVKVLDLTRVLAGPVATRFLAGFGARVLRVDPPWWGEPGVEPEVTLGKRRCGLDLRNPNDRAAFNDLLSQADILVHGYRPGALEGLGLGPEALRAQAPHLIDISLCAYGWTGPWAGRRGFDSLVQMSCGIAAEGMVRKGAAGPVPLPVQALDHATGYLMAAAALRALRVRAQSGRILSARLSLARTAHLLMSAGAHPFEGAAIALPFDVPEETGWGPAKRIRFPLQIDGAGPVWPHAAGPLRVDPPSGQ